MELIFAWCAGVGMFVVLCLVKVLARQLERRIRGNGKSQRNDKA